MDNFRMSEQELQDERKSFIKEEKNEVKTYKNKNENRSIFTDKINGLFKGLFTCCKIRKYKNENDEDEMQRILQNETQQPETSKVKNKIKGLIMAFILTFFIGLSAVCVPLLERKIPDFELNSFRSGLSLIIIAVALLVQKQLPMIPKSELPGLMLCILDGIFTPIAIFISVSLIPLSYYKSLFFTFTILSGLIFFPLCLGERTEIRSILFAIVCIIGVILSIQPEFIFTRKKHLVSQTDNLAEFSNNGTETESNTKHLNDYLLSSTLIGCILAAAAGVGDTFHIIILKRNPYLQENIVPVLFWVSTLNTLLCLVIMAILEEAVMPDSMKQVLLIVGHSLSFIMAWFGLIMATKFISGNTINIIYSTLVVLMLIPQYTLLKHILPGNKNWIEVLGTVLVFIGATTGSIMDIQQGK